jgi:hypothetical protein
MVEDSIAVSGSLVGSCMWMLAARSYADYDGYTLYLPLTPPAASDDLATVAEVKRYSVAIRAARPPLAIQSREFVLPGTATSARPTSARSRFGGCWGLLTSKGHPAAK